jgi:hypothetical protein
MLIKSLQEMEIIVSNNDSLKWDGWTVVSLTPTESGTMSKNGILIDDTWHIQKRFELTEDGWNIPNKIAE